MCSICGGTIFDQKARRIWELSEDRGRDHHGLFIMDGLFQWVGNHRAIPTTEVEKPIEEQPVGGNPKIVFNGIIANDKELGVRDGEADTSVLPRVLDFKRLETFRNSLYKIKGSFALAVLFQDTGMIWLACNYKPIWIAKKNQHLYFSSLEHHLEGLEAHRFPPYSVGCLQTGEILPIERLQSNNALVICSSGLDSTAVAAYAKYHHKHIHLLHYDYGCLATHREIDCIHKISNYLGCGFSIIKLPSIFGNKSIMQKDPDKIAEGKAGAEYAHEWVPARNLVMLSNTVAYAEAYGYGHIYLGTNLEEGGSYPDNEEQFILDFNNLLYGAVQNGIKIEIHTPLGGLMKHEIVNFGRSWNAPFELTWSCYRGGDKHCGKCGPCFMRRTAFERNNLIDPVEYEE